MTVTPLPIPGGSLSPKTRYLIRGFGIGAPAPKAEEGKDPPKDMAPNAERNKAVNEAIQKMREEAKEYGLVDDVLTNLKRRAEVGSS